MKFLTDVAIEHGLAVIAELDRLTTEVPLTAAFWAEESDSHQWRLMLASPEVWSRDRPNPFSKAVHEVMQRIPYNGLPIGMFSVLEPNDKVLHYVRKLAERPEHLCVPGRWLTLSDVWDGPFDDVYLHRIDM
ncbi:MAG TPA: hypothetical protein VL424_14915 [Pararobbsia sp.]|jgi:hypothetical protein|nr:hypothetical protein [Pararobbsia sp.]